MTYPDFLNGICCNTLTAHRTALGVMTPNVRSEWDFSYSHFQSNFWKPLDKNFRFTILNCCKIFPTNSGKCSLTLLHLCPSQTNKHYVILSAPTSPSGQRIHRNIHSGINCPIAMLVISNLSQQLQNSLLQAQHLTPQLLSAASCRLIQPINIAHWWVDHLHTRPSGGVKWPTVCVR